MRRRCKGCGGFVFCTSDFVFLSRNAGSAEDASTVDASVAAITNHRSPPRLKSTDLGPGDMGYTDPKAKGQGGVTREEMVRLFGSALRVR